MKFAMTVRRAVVVASIVAMWSAPARAQDRIADNGAMIGELRSFAIDPDNRRLLDTLHRNGWLEADGRLLKRADFPLLYGVVGLAWTPETSTRDRFAVPDLTDRQRLSNNPYGVLGPGDLVTGGRSLRRTLPPRSFIYVGRDVSAVIDHGPASRR